MAGRTWKIYWNEYAKDTYLHGTRLLFHAKDDVEFSNGLMPPGTVVKRWYSKTNYQSMQVEPSLPMIDGEGSYHIRLDVEPPGGLLLKLVFYDRYDQEAGLKIVRDAEADFQCPLKTFSYEVQLVNAGAARFHFHSIRITERTDGEQKAFSHIKKSKKGTGDDKNPER